MNRLLLALCLLGLRSQAACLISGTVADSTMGKPLPNSKVYAKRQNNKNVSILHLTNDEGRFCFENLEPDRYQVVVDRAGYLTTVHGGKPGAKEGMPLSVDGKSEVPPLTFRLLRTAAISGTLLDATGEPREGVRVELDRKAWDKGWRRDEVDSVVTDDRGAFRFALLPPGIYYAAVQPAAPERSFLDEHGQPIRAIEATTYYKNSSSFARATPIPLEAGREVENLILTAERVTPRRLSGRLGPSIRVEGLRRLFVQAEGERVIDLNPQQDGSFVGENLTPQKYRITFYGTAVTIASEVDLTSGDVEGFVLGVEPPFHLPFSVRVEGPAPVAPVQLEVHNLGDNSTRNSSFDNGEYRFVSIQPGTYAVDARKYFVKSLAVDGRPKNPLALDLRAGVPGAVEIVLRPNAARIQGHIDRGAAELATSVILVNEAMSRVEVMSDTVVADQTGGFKFELLAPGKYRLLAIEGFDEGLWGSPELVAVLKDKSVAVELKETDDRSATVPVITDSEWTAALRKVGM